MSDWRAPWSGPISAGHRVIEGVQGRCGAAVHDYVGLSLHTRGRTTVVQRGRLEIGPGDVHLVPAGEMHRLESARDMAAWGVGFHASLYAAGEAASLLGPFERARAGGAAVVRVPAGRQEHLAYLFGELAAATGGDRMHSVDSASVQRSLLTLILAEVASAAALVPAPEGQSSLVGDALRFIERNCLGPLSLGDVARAVRRSPAHVTTALRLATGKTAVEWMIAGRLSEARRRLLHTDESVETITERVGYADPTHFIRLFRRAEGTTPAAWRAERRGRSG